MKLIITVDTEADNQWKRKKEITLKNIFLLPRFQALCERYAVIPIYLVSYEVANNIKAVKILKKWQDMGKAEIGAHLHPWTTPPFKEYEKVDPIFQSFPNELKDEDFRCKLKVLTDKIEEAFGKKPLSFRAGRWGFKTEMVKYLLRYGYKIDCSVTPKISWKDFAGAPNGKGGPDFRSFSARPSYFRNEDGRKLLEVPMSILYCSRLAREDSNLSRWFSLSENSIFKKIINKLFFRLKWCRIFPGDSVRELEKIYYAVARNKMPAIEFMIHSSELMPGCSPYCKTEEDVEKIYEVLAKFLKFCNDKNIHSSSLKEFAANYGQY